MTTLRTANRAAATRVNAATNSIASLQTCWAAKLPWLRMTMAKIETAEEAILDQATAARTIVELEAEIATLRHLEGQAAALRRSAACL